MAGINVSTTLRKSSETVCFGSYFTAISELFYLALHRVKCVCKSKDILTDHLYHMMKFPSWQNKWTSIHSEQGLTEWICNVANNKKWLLQLSSWTLIDYFYKHLREKKKQNEINKTIWLCFEAQSVPFTKQKCLWTNVSTKHFSI